MSLKILEICKAWGMSNPNDIRHWMDDIDKEIERQVKAEIEIERRKKKVQNV